MPQYCSPKSALHIAEWSVWYVITSWHTPAGARMTFSVLWLARPGMISLCLLSSLTSVSHSRTLCSFPTGLLSIQWTRQPLSCPWDSAGAVLLFGVCACVCTHMCSYTFLMAGSFSFREALPRELWSRLFRFPRVHSASPFTSSVSLSRLLHLYLPVT